MELDLTKYLIILASGLLVLSFLMVRYYASRRTSIIIQLLATVAFAAGFSGTVLLPVDLSLNIRKNGNDNDDNINNNDNIDDGNNDDSNGDDYNGTLLPWHILFWTTSALAWVILPIVKEMLLSGQFTIYQQFREGVRKRLRFVLIVSLIGGIGIIWLAIYLHSFNVIPIIITLANTYGLLLISLLLGYGLIALPRSLWRQASPEYELRKAQIMALTADEALFESVWELQDCEYAIDTAMLRIVDLDEYSTNDMHYKNCVNDLLQRKNETASLKPELHMRRTPVDERQYDNEFQNELDDAHTQLGNKPSMNELISLNRRLKRSQENLYNTEKRWESIVQRSSYFQEALHKWSGRLIWIKYARTILFRFIAIIAMWLSGIILWTEATLALPYNLTPFALVQEALSKHDRDGGYDAYDFVFQLSVLLPLLYMFFCVSSSILKLTMFGPYALRGYRQSHGVALILNAQFLARLIFPLGYNYLLMLKYDTSSCAFSTFIGQMAVIPLFGTTFSVYAPLLIIALCGFTLLNIYPKIMNLLRIDHEDAILLGDQETIDAKVNEGKLLLRRRNGQADNSCEMPMVAKQIRPLHDEIIL